MGDFLIGLGVLLAVLGPLLLIPVVWALGRWVARPPLGKALPDADPGRLRALGFAAAAVVVAGCLLASYLPGKARFDALCAVHGEPVIEERVRVDGFFRTALFPYEAASYLREGGFAYVEAPHPYEEGVVVRYSLGEGDEVRQERIPAASSAYGVEERFSQPASGISMTEKRVYETASGRDLAHAAMIHYSGGPLSLFLGSYGSSSCPDVRSAEGSDRFGRFYYLESIVLAGGAPPGVSGSR